MPGLSVRRRWMLGFAAAAAIAAPVWAMADPPSAGGSRADQAVLNPIEQLNQALIAVMKAGRATPFQQRYDMLAPAVENALDLPYILRISVGLGWSALSQDEQQALLAAFQRYTVASYLDNFDSYDGQQFVVSPDTRSGGNNEQVVSTQIIPKQGTGHKLDYVMRQVGNVWKAVDVLADGSISRVAVQRSDFSSLLSKGGAPALVASLQQKTAALSRG